MLRPVLDTLSGFKFWLVSVKGCDGCCWICDCWLWAPVTLNHKKAVTELSWADDTEFTGSVDGPVMTMTDYKNY